jgi:hypothetical protein
MSGQLSLFGDLELDPLIRTAPEEKGSSAILALEVAAHPVKDSLAIEGIHFLPGASGLQEADLSPASISVAPPTPVMTPEEQFDVVLQAHWINSQDLAYCMVNTVLPEDDGSLYDDFTTYIKACRLADTGHGTRPRADERFDRLAWCLGSMAFSRLTQEQDHADVIWTETTVLDLALDLSFDEDELAELREFGLSGASGERVNSLAAAIEQYVNREISPATGETPDGLQKIDEIAQSPYAILFDRLGLPKTAYPDFSNRDAVLAALLEAIGTDEHRLDLVLSFSDITEKELFKAAENDIETKRHLLEMARRQLKRDLDSFYATSEWHQHRTFARYPVFLTDGALHLAEHGGADATSAFWLMDIIASYQGEKQMKRIENPQFWKIVCTGEGSRRSCVVTCGNHPEKPIIRQETEYTNFLLNEYELYASLEPFDEGGRLALIISLISER